MNNSSITNEFPYKSPLLITVFSIIVILTFIFNLYILCTIIFNKKLHNTTNFYFVSTSLTGLIVASLNMTFETIYITDNFKWKHELTLCIIWYTLDLCTCFINLASFTIISYIRYSFIKSPNKEWASKFMQKSILVLIWILPLLVISLVNGVFMSENPPLKDDCYIAYGLNILIPIIGLFIALPLFSLIVVNFKTMIQLKVRFHKMSKIHARLPRVKILVIPEIQNTTSHHHHQHHHQGEKNSSNNMHDGPHLAKEQKALLTLIFLSIILIVCWLPYIIILPMVF